MGASSVSATIVLQSVTPALTRLIRRQKLTFSAFVYPTSVSNGNNCSIVYVGQAGTTNFYNQMYMANGNLAAATIEGSVTSGLDLNVNAWNHCAAVFRYWQYVGIFQNGVASGSRTDLSEGAAYPNQPYRFTVCGDARNSRAIAGMSVAHVAVWQDELTLKEIQSLNSHEDPMRIRPDALVAYWPMEGPGPVYTDVVSGFVLSPPTATSCGYRESSSLRISGMSQAGDAILLV